MRRVGEFDGALGETLHRPVCAALPSGQAAFDLVSGDWGAIVPVIGTAAARAALIGVGMAVVGERKHLVRNAIGGAAAIEGFVLMWAIFKRAQS
jgi:hypothetical protein